VGRLFYEFPGHFMGSFRGRSKQQLGELVDGEMLLVQLSRQEDQCRDRGMQFAVLFFARSRIVSNSRASQSRGSPGPSGDRADVGREYAWTLLILCRVPMVRSLQGYRHRSLLSLSAGVQRCSGSPRE
jgi:hypothetical protein